MDFKKVRKAVTAGVSAGVGAAVTYQVGVGWKFDAEHVAGSLAAFVAAAVPAGWLTWRVPNAPVSRGTLESRTRGFDPSAP